MVGLGCGARSYTRGLHYSLDYAVAPEGRGRSSPTTWPRPRRSSLHAEHGFALDADEQRRRYLLQSLLNAEGLDVGRYPRRFGTDPADDFPDLRDFAELGLLECDGGRWVPTDGGPGAIRRDRAVVLLRTACAA